MSNEKKITGEELQIEWSDEAKAQIENDPEIATAVKEFSARMRQAYQDVHDGKYATIDDAMEAMGAKQIEFDDDDA